MKINSGFNYLCCDLITSLKDSRLSQVISQNKKIIAIAAAILSVLAVGYAIYKYCSKAKDQTSNESNSKTTNTSQKVLSPDKNKEIQNADLDPSQNDNDSKQTSQSNGASALDQQVSTENENSQDASGEVATTEITNSSPTVPIPDDSTTAQTTLPLNNDEKPVAQDVAPEKVIVVETEEEKIEKKIIADFGPEMVEALGGVDKVLSIPVLTHWDGQIAMKHFTAPIMRGYHGEGRPFLLFCYATKQVSTPLNITGEHIERTAEGLWKGTYSYPNELTLRFPNPVNMNSLAGKHMLDRIRRLINDQPMGMMEKYKDVVLFKPANLEEIRPVDAYLEGEELTQYMELDTIFFERKPPEGATEILLWDPTKSDAENINS